MVDETAERIAALGRSPCGTAGALVAQRDRGDYSSGRAGTLEHLGALDVVYASGSRGTAAPNGICKSLCEYSRQMFRKDSPVS